MKSGRWTEITPSQFPWEQQALAYLREKLPDAPPFRAWSNFEFIALDGSINEVDLLVVSTTTVFLVEIKSWAGRLVGDAGTWVVQNESREKRYDNPRILANRKAKRLKSLLQRNFRERMPYFEPVVFLSNQGLKCELDESARHGVYVGHTHGQANELSSIVDVLTGRFDNPQHNRIAPSLSKAIARQCDKAGIRPSSRSRKVNQYRFEELIRETDHYQDWMARHESLDNKQVMVRLYPIRAGASQGEQDERRRAAEREYQILDGAHHEGLLRVRDFVNTERGPAVLFEHDADFQRLDHFLDGQRDTLSLEERLELVRQLGETLQYAHSRRMVHRTLNPQSVLVKKSGKRLQSKIFNWNTAQMDSTRIASRLTLDQSALLELAGGSRTGAYLAPEFFTTGDAQPEALDIFSLGALAYYIVAGVRPAEDSAELESKLLGDRGLRISSVLDGAPASLQDLIQLATDPNVEDRPASIAEFLNILDQAERELTRPEPVAAIHPLDAKPNDELPGGFKVLRRLGKGATALALLVEREGEESVLKIALHEDNNERLRREGAVLQTLRHQNIVEYFETLEIGDLVALRLASAGNATKTGTYTLAQRLREEGRLSLDLLQRFGEELLGVVDWLESQGVSHRDIKPENVGVSSTRAKKALTIVLFDFSLTGTPVENVSAGTPPYLDPFLKLRKPPRWDPSAERFAAAMTLYEMATGQLPTWGDGQSSPALLDCEVALDSELFDPSVRDGLASFFVKALARDHRRRFDNAEEMRLAWIKLFQRIDLPTTTTHTDEQVPVDIEALLADATEDTPVATLGLSARLLDVLDRVGVHTLGNLLELPRIRLYRNKGIGNKVVAELRELAELTARVFAERGDEVPQEGEEEPPVDQFGWNLSQIERRLVGDQVADDQAAALNVLLCRNDDMTPESLPSLREVARTLKVHRRVPYQHLVAARKRWLKQPWMTMLRDDLAGILEAAGGVMTVDDIALALLAARGAERNADRRRISFAVTRAALETEAAREQSRYLLSRGEPKVLIAATQRLGESFQATAESRAAYARALGEACDALAQQDPLVPPVRAFDELRSIEGPQDDATLPPNQMLKLGVSAAKGAALSSRQEIYPVGMAADRALKLGMGSLLGPRQLTVEQIQDRIASRYPRAKSLPGRPALDKLLDAAGLPLRWEPANSKYETVLDSVSQQSSYSLHRSVVGGIQDTAEEEAMVIEGRLDTAVRQGDFLVLSTPPKYLALAERALLSRRELKLVSLEVEMIAAMKKVASELGAQWDVVVRADSSDRNSADWRRLIEVARRAAEELADELLAAPKPILLVRAGLLARYGQLGVLDSLSEHCQSQQAPARLVLVPGDDQGGMPSVDNARIPIVLATQFVRLTRPWLRHAKALETHPRKSKAAS